AIANPSRLEKFLPKNLCARYAFEDHYMFTMEELRDILNHHNATSLLVTTKDAVKIEDFNLPLSILNLNLNITSSLHKSIDFYISSKKGTIYSCVK
ncbi:MAG: tetraacyldisaccharide 4'-kinase, partial [Campylobacteraceae bacterium]|nr:tetraacyldisaccharide 4'-kinase [Campylobacteraceae bacterium]